jgi:uncharacterized caspase-like protein
MTLPRSICAAALLAALPALAEARRFALVVGDAKGGSGTRPLRYAERDARRMHAILTRLGGVRPEDARLLTAATADEVRSAMGDLSARAEQARARGDETVLVVYYSGHAKDGDLRLGDTRMPLVELREALRNAPADVRIGLLDSCQSGAITRAKGVRAAPAFDVQQAQAASTRPRGLVLIASSSADEESQESDDIGASFFTHYLASGLLGDADASGDGKVTLAEAYAYAYARTVGETAETRAGTQHPVYLYDLGGAGDVVLTELAPARGALVFQRRIALAPGDYLVKKRDGDTLLLGSFSLAEGPVEIADARLSRRPLSEDPQKGASGPRWSLLGTGGGQFFFDSAARNGLFPPAALLGAELGVRDDLGHDLVWGADLSFGGGAATLRLPGVAPIPERFVLLTGGASLWRDFPAGDSFTISVGARVAFLYLARSFDNRPDLPAQNFFTLTPGLQAAFGWRFSERWSAVARGRVNYLFYNVDKAQNLGYAEFALGVDYALGL